ncbi:MAG TPA: fluoride efflux transporter CrcB [Stellaceae bacterium]|nr:fluoride efflux transporter CrcB [Stellaceae bacterium]
MTTYFWVALGGALGSIARYWMTNVVALLLGPRFPWGTILINILGSFVIGFVAHLTTPVGSVPLSFDLRAFILVGICGGYTTFSSFSLQTLELARSGNWLGAGGNILLSVVLCLIAVWAGYLLGQALGGTGAAPHAK